MNKVKFFDYLQQYKIIENEITSAVSRVLNSGQLILGKEVSAFEEEFGAFLEGEGSCVGVANGTDALVIALTALDIARNHEVITVANTAVPTVSAIRQAGATPVFCDIDPRTCLIDLNQIENHITSSTRAIIAVHLYGNVVDIPKLKRIIGDRSIAIIEDCAQAHGAKLRGVAAGTMGDISAFSFYPTKNLGAYGDAGLCYSRDPNLVTEMKRIRMYGFNENNCSLREGINSRLDELQAAILRVKLKHLPAHIENRRILAELYSSYLPEDAVQVPADTDVNHANHLFVIKIKNRDRVKAELSNRAIDTAIHYPTPIHRMEAYRFLNYDEGDLPETNLAASSVLSLPLYPELSQESVLTVCNELSNVLA